MDEYNNQLLKNLKPENWTNPQPAPRYNLVVLGGGPSGLVAAMGAAKVGAKVALVEEGLIGGDCLNVGCVPSKCLLRSAEAASEINSAEEYGIEISGKTNIDFPEVMKKMRMIRARLSTYDSVEKLKKAGIDVFFGKGRFISGNQISIEEKKLNFQKAIIATGGRAGVPTIEGINEVDYLTNENIFDLTERPDRLIVLGGGPLGCEMAQAFARLGSEVIIVEQKSQLLIREDGDISEILHRSFKREGIVIKLDSTLKKITQKNNAIQIQIESTDSGYETIEADKILIAAGRKANVENIGLEKANIKYDEKSGIVVDDLLRTTNNDVFAVGDVCLKYKFTHAADSAAAIALENALFKRRKKFSKKVIPWCTFTEPSVAHVGMSEKQAKEKGIKYEVCQKHFSDVDRAIINKRELGKVKILVKKKTGKIIGAMIVGCNAGEMLNEITLAMQNNIKLSKISDAIHLYPTTAEAIKKSADKYVHGKSNAVLKKLRQWWLEKQV